MLAKDFGIRNNTEIDQWGPIDGKLLYPSFWILAAAKYVLKVNRVAWPTYSGIYDHDRFAWYWEKDAMQRQGEQALKRWITPMAAMKILWRKYDNVCRQIGRAEYDTDKRPPVVLAKKLHKLLIRLWTYALVPELANFAAPDYLRKQLAPLVPANAIDEGVETLIATERLSFLQQSELELLAVALRGNLEQYAARWYWVENSYYENKVLTAGYFGNQIRKMSRTQMRRKLQILRRHSQETISKKRQFAKKYRLSSRIVQLARSLAFSIWWQDHRKATTWRLHSVLDKLNLSASREFKISIDDIAHYTAEEWLKLFETGKTVSPSTIRKRKNLFLVVVTPRKYGLIYGRVARDFANRMKNRADVAEQGLISGVSTYRGKGKISGKVRILLSPRFAAKMKAGEILVAPMTSPDYIVAMRKARAIITDVGGLMSHAAVISRELRVPCIVGTKVATKVLKDGDLVEVDANKGIVRKL